MCIKYTSRVNPSECDTKTTVINCRVAFCGVWCVVCAPLLFCVLYISHHYGFCLNELDAGGVKT